MVLIQYGFFEDQYIGAVKQKLMDMAQSNPEAFSSEKSCLTEYWRIFDHLEGLLGERWPSFVSWLNRATSPETITRARRAINEELRNKEEGYECK